MADSDSLIEGNGTVKKNIHWFIGGLIAIVIVVAIFAQDASSKKRKEKEPTVTTQVDVKPEGIKGVLDNQKATHVENEADIANTKVNVPSIVTDGVGKNAKQTEALNAKEAQAVEDAKRDAQLNGSSIMVIGNELGLGNMNRQPIEAPKPIPVNETQLRKAMSGLPVSDNQSQPADSKKKIDPISEDSANSPYTIFEGAVIPAVLMTKIDSQLPGQVTGVVTQDVYDGVTGSHLVVPKGSLLYGTYGSNSGQGQNRLMVAFTRLILPNGRSVSLLGMPSADKTGQQGLEGAVNNHYFQRYGLSFMSALLGVLVDKQNSGTTVINTGGSSNNSGVTSAAGTVLVEMSRAEQQRSSQIKPTITIQQGEKFNINVNHDIAISPY